MRIHKYLRSKISYLLIFGLLISIAMPEVAEAEATKYRVKTWLYGGFLDCDVLLFPPGGVHYRFFPLAIDFASLHGFGIGTAMGEIAFPSNKNKMLAIGTWFPAYLYWVPFAKWNRSGSSYLLAQPLIYTFFGFSNWSGANSDSRYFRGGIGMSSSLFSFLAWGIETGFISYNNDTTVNSLYIGANVWLDGWEVF